MLLDLLLGNLKTACAGFAKCARKPAVPLTHGEMGQTYIVLPAMTLSKNS